MSYVIVNDPSVQSAALALTKGEYQRNIILGSEALSGATLRGKAGKYRDKYKESSKSLLARVRAAGLNVYEVVGAYNKRILVFG